MHRMDPGHPRFEWFTDRLASAVFLRLPDGTVSWQCDGTCKRAAFILRCLHNIAIAESFQHFQHSYNAFCDCEILLNVDPTNRLSAGHYRAGACRPTVDPNFQSDLVATAASLRVDALRLIHGGEAFHLALAALLRGERRRRAKTEVVKTTLETTDPEGGPK